MNYHRNGFDAERLWIKDCSERLTVKNRYGEKVSCTKYKLIRGE